MLTRPKIRLKITPTCEGQTYRKEREKKERKKKRKKERKRKKEEKSPRERAEPRVTISNFIQESGEEETREAEAEKHEE